jgi:hypothetical protein
MRSLILVAPLFMLSGCLEQYLPASAAYTARTVERFKGTDLYATQRFDNLHFICEPNQTINPTYYVYDRADMVPVLDQQGAHITCDPKLITTTALTKVEK